MEIIIVVGLNPAGERADQLQGTRPLPQPTVRDILRLYNLQPLLDDLRTDVLEPGNLLVN